MFWPLESVCTHLQKTNAKSIACLKYIYVNIQFLKECNSSCFMPFTQRAYDQSKFTACVTSAQEQCFLSQLIHQNWQIATSIWKLSCHHCFSKGISLQFATLSRSLVWLHEYPSIMLSDGGSSNPPTVTQPHFMHEFGIITRYNGLWFSSFNFSVYENVIDGNVLEKYMGGKCWATGNISCCGVACLLNSLSIKILFIIILGLQVAQQLILELCADNSGHPHGNV